MNLLFRSASVLALFAAAFSARAGLLGSTVNLSKLNFAGYNFGGVNYGNAVVVDPGVEFSGVDSGYFQVDLTDSTLTYRNASSYRITFGAASSFSLNVLLGPKFASATYESGVATTALSVTDGTLNLGTGYFYEPGASTVISFTTNPTPEPSAFAALGLGAVAVLRRRKRA